LPNIIAIDNPNCLSEVTRLLAEGNTFLGTIAFARDAEAQEDGSVTYKLTSSIHLAVQERSADMQSLEKFLAGEIQRGWLGVSTKWELKIRQAGCIPAGLNEK
jgi:hypothetical protein